MQDDVKETTFGYRSQLRQKWLNRYIPFDASFDFHRIAAYTGVVLSVVHVIGHILNFRNLARQSSAVLACLVPSLIADDGSESRMTFPQLCFIIKLSPFYYKIISSD